MRVVRGATPQSAAEERANCITHGLGLVLSIGGWGVLMALAGLLGGGWHVLSCGIYGSTLVFLYAASTCYHSARRRRTKRMLRIVDHVAIFLLIAGTYTPFAMVFLRDGIGWTLLALVWGVAVVGLLFKIFSRRRFHWSTTGLYLLMGWLSVLFIEPVLAAVPLGALLWIAVGGFAYTIGVVFYRWEALPYSHAIWHVFVLIGSISHYLAVLLYVVPVGA